MAKLVFTCDCGEDVPLHFYELGFGSDIMNDREVILLNSPVEIDNIRVGNRRVGCRECVEKIKAREAKLANELEDFANGSLDYLPLDQPGAKQS